MEALTKTAWAMLALLHLAPSLPLVRPGMIETLYGVPSGGDVGVLLTHRAGLFAAVMIAALFAMLDASSRRMASVVLAISMVGFLVVYLRAGLPPGALRKIAVADLIGLLPLAFVAWQAWTA